MRILKQIAACAVAALALAASSAGAQDQPVSNQLKIGFVEAVRVIDLAPQGRDALQGIEAELAPRESVLRTLREELAALEEELQQRTNLSEDERSEKEQEIRKLSRRLERGQEELREDFNIRRNEELDRLQALINRVISKLAVEQGYDLILQDPVVFVSARINITDMVLEELTKEYNEGQ